jgi:DNA-binding MarR family transcriptional regulator
MTINKDKIIRNLIQNIEGALSECKIASSQLVNPSLMGTDKMTHRYDQAESIRRSIIIRNNLFPRRMLSDPVWEIMLFLYASSRNGDRVSITQICEATDIPPTTVLRTVGNMKRRGLLVINRDNLDNRKKSVQLTTQTKTSLTYWLILYGEDGS